MSDEIVLVVNGKQHTVQAAGDTPLLYVLRNELGLTGPQYGCGEETCGACMVLLGDQATTSCKLPVSRVGRSRITTLEGLMEEGELHPAQRAFLEHGPGHLAPLRMIQLRQFRDDVCRAH